MTKKIIFIVSLVIIFLVGFIAYSGFFTKVRIVEKEIGPYLLVGKEYKGDYKNSAKYQDSIYNDLNSKGFEITDGFGIYRDNPDKVPVEKRRSMVGCILSEKDTMRIGELERNNYLVQKMNRTNCMVAEFPYKNFLSIIAAVQKVYPVLNDYRIDKIYDEVPSLEIYKQDIIIIAMEIKTKSNN